MTHRLEQSWARVRDLLASPGWDGDDARQALQALTAAAHAAPPSVLAEVAGRMGEFLRTAPVQEAGLVALAGGAIVEHGGPIEPLAGPILTRMPGVLAASGRFVAAADREFADAEEPEDEPPPDSVLLGGIPVPLEWVQELGTRDPEAVDAYVSLDTWCQPLIAMATRQRSLLEGLAAEGGLRNALRPLAEATPGAKWLSALSEAPLSETFVFVDARSGRVFELLVDGVAFNFELHTLLDAALAGPLGHPTPDQAVLDCLSGRGPQSCDTPSDGRWNLYTWHAAAMVTDGLQQAPSDHWIWNEGRPSDIPRFEAHRVVVAGAPAYVRSWTTSRTFPALFPRIEIIRELPSPEARALLRALRAHAPAPLPKSAGSVQAPGRLEALGRMTSRLLARFGIGRRRS